MRLHISKTILLSNKHLLMNLALPVATAAFVESPASSCPDIWSFIFRSYIFSAPAELSGSGSGAGRVEKFSPSPST